MPQLKQSKLVTLFGILFLIIGSSMFSYSFYLIQENEQTLNSTKVTLDQLWNFESTTNWWKNVSIMLIFPLTSVFILIAGITMSSQAVLQGLKNSKNTKPNLEKTKIFLRKNVQKIKMKKEKPVEGV